MTPVVRLALLLSAAIATTGLSFGDQTPAATTRVTGHVRDEAGAAIRGARVELVPRERVPLATVTDDAGAYSLDVPSKPRVMIAASHPDYGVQYLSGFSFDAPQWLGYQYAGAPPTQPVDLVLRKGVILRGRATERDGAPFAGQEIFLIPAYVGSGPARFPAPTDATGAFAFPRAVLNERFELVGRSLGDWHPAKPGAYVRITQNPKAWLAAATADAPIHIEIERYTLVAITIVAPALQNRVAEVWTRWPNNDGTGTTMKIDQTGRAQIVMEQGVKCELWVAAGVEGHLSPGPWTKGQSPQWTGTPAGPAEVRITRAP